MGPNDVKKIGKTSLTPTWSENLGLVDASMAVYEEERSWRSNAVSEARAGVTLCSPIARCSQRRTCESATKRQWRQQTDQS